MSTLSPLGNRAIIEQSKTWAWPLINQILQRPLPRTNHFI